MSETFFASLPANTHTKGLGPLDAKARMGDIASQGWNILQEQVSLPVAVLSEEKIQHNLAWMQEFIDRYKVKLAPHGKTTMSPELFRMQIDAGAWGITLATAAQIDAAFAFGVRNVLMANQLVGKGNMAIIANLMRQDESFEFCCIVDSADNVDALGHDFAERGQTLRILLEFGIAGGRTGIRNTQQEQAVLAAVARWPQSLSLVGVELYEGVLNEEAPIRAFLQHVVERTQILAESGIFKESAVILSGAGSAWYDVVAEEFSKVASHLDAAGHYALDVVLRPGCYLTHDVGAYHRASDRIKQNNPIAREMNFSLLPALQVWAYVQSLPEPGRAIVGLGKRDTSSDAGFPVVSGHYRPQSAQNQAYAAVVPAPEAWKIFAMMDQHAFMSIPEGADIKIGDMLSFDISHPCLTFDKWRQLLLINEQYDVTGAVSTWF